MNRKEASETREAGNDEPAANRSPAPPSRDRTESQAPAGAPRSADRARDRRGRPPGEIDVDWSDPDDQLEAEPEHGDFDFEPDWEDG